MRASILRTGFLCLTALAAGCSSAGGGAPTGGPEPAGASVEPTGTASATGAAAVPAAQVQQGRDAFLASCTACHASNEFTARPFLNRWSNRTAADLYGVLSSTMPEDAPASLPPERYVAIVAYILNMNGFDADASLPAWDTAAMAGVSLAPLGGE